MSYGTEVNDRHPAKLGMGTLHHWLAQWLAKWWSQWRIVLVSLLAVMMLSGCVNYEVGLNFSTPHRGTIIQHIKLGQRFTALSGQSAEQWLVNLERRVKALGGKTNHLSSQEVIVTIPFYNGEDLVTRFNQFFTASPEAGSPQPVELSSLNPNLGLRQTNAVLAIRNHLSYDIDLRSLGVVSADGSQVINTSALLELQLGLSTPFGATVVEPETRVERVEMLENGRSVVWVLKPGQENHLEAIFWLPNPLGIGTLVIVLTVMGGAFLRYRIMQPPVSLPFVPFT